MEISKFCVFENASLIEVMEKINENSYGIVFVINKKNQLIGVITDGDIRRYILANGNLDSNASRIMNKEPKFTFYKEKIKSYELMDNYKIHTVPILNGNHQIIDIIFDSNKTEKMKLDIPVVIMAGGKGTRLYPYTQILPKPLIPINDKTITEIIMDQYQSFGCEKFTMIINYKKELIKAFFNDEDKDYDVSFVEEKEFLGTAGGLKLLVNKINGTFFLNNCDVLIEEDYSEILKYHRQSKNIITLVCALKKEIIPYGTIKTDETGQIKELKEKPNFDFLINTGLYIIEPEIFDEIPDNTFIHITDVIQNCIDKGFNVGVYPISEECWMDMGQIEELENMKIRLSKGEKHE